MKAKLAQGESSHSLPLALAWARLEKGPVSQALDFAATAVFTEVSLLLSLWPLTLLSETLRGPLVLSSSVVSQHW